tara:strand:+ start:10478 stop:10960 length:483 start_codon:yes stop_codon:yes gene_type:complete
METTPINSLPNNFQGSVGGGTSNENRYYNEQTQKDMDDIPQRERNVNPEKLTAAPETRVNFLPESENEVYYIPNNDVQIKKPHTSDSIIDIITNTTFEDIKLPIILFLMYFVFELSIVRNFLKQTFSFSYENDQITHSGMFILAFAYSFTFFIFTKFVEL